MATTGQDATTTDREYREQRLAEARERRTTTAELNTSRTYIEHPKNDDETEFPSGIACFTKGLPHDDNGEPDASEYEELLNVLESGDFSGVTLGGDRPLVNPEASRSFNSTGLDPHDIFVPAAPGMDSDRTAAEMIEVYWQALCRDVEFSDYDTAGVIDDAADEIDAQVAQTDFDAPTDGGTVTPETGFRGSLSGCETGPYVSQFLYWEVPRGVFSHHQQFEPLKEDTEYMTDFGEWLRIQRGKYPATGNGDIPSNEDLPRENQRYITTGRDLATYVRVDRPQLAYLNAALILQSMDAPLDRGNPFEESSIDYGHNDAQSAVVGITNAAFHAAWYHKWQVHRRLRPEAYGGRVRNLKEGVATTSAYNVPSRLLDSEAVSRTHSEHGTYLLSQAYPEGSPTHPSYPAGHSTVAGACVTVLKAFYDTSHEFDEVKAPDPTDPTDLDDVGVGKSVTVGGELNKLAANIAIGRDWAGVHYRTDATAGFALGERLAIGMLAVRLRAKGTRSSFRLETFGGNEVLITPNGVESSTLLQDGR